ncbi:hypothetical protein BC832DRAFT_549110 [Gaertneriomyces semiglobifer]|nr:hypothetical protein BC832DRAFT_549110 [Gaertneriomyces semiglobifer]
MTRTIENWEWALVLGRSPAGEPIALGPFVEDILKGDYTQVLTSPAAKEIFGTDLTAQDSNVEVLSETLDITAYIVNQVTAYLSKPTATDSTTSELQFQVVCIGVAALYAFLQVGWTGPALAAHAIGLLPERLHQHSAQLQARTLEALSEDGEEAYSLTTEPLFLSISKAILVQCSDSLTDIKSIAWWRARCLFTQQKLLDNLSETMSNVITANMDEARSKLPSLEEHRELHARYNLEYGLVHHYYHRDHKAVPCFEAAQDASNFKWSLTGARGKRTKHQDFDVAQLVVMAESSSTEPANDSADDAAASKPVTLELNDDTLLENVKFTEETQGQGNLKIIDQCILLAFCLNVKNTNPVDGLTTEEMVPYVRRVLEHANNWMVHTMALLLKTRLESIKSRTVERAALQLQALVDQFKLEEPSPAERSAHIFSILIPPKWEMERELGERFVSLGVTRSALEIFERLEMWDDVISCYQMLEQNKKAEALVEERLKVQPKSAKLYCVMGDLKSDPSYYEKAWQVSEGRYARAMRSLGGYYFKKQEWVKAIECYHRALSLNALFENSWFVMGCAAMRVEDFDQAIRAFSRVVSLDHENGEAWTNLASVYIKQGKKREAWRALREALKNHFDNSKIWENFLYVSVDLCEYQEAMHAMDRVLEIRANRAGEKNPVVDEEILDILVRAVVGDMTDANGVGASHHARRLQHLLNNITSKISNSPAIFRSASKFYASQGMLRKALDYEQKAYRCLLNHPRLSEDEEVFKLAVQAAFVLVDAYVTMGPQMEEVRMASADETEAQMEMVCKDWKYQAKTTLKTLVGRTKSTFEDTPLHDELKEKLKEVNEL